MNTSEYKLAWVGQISEQQLTVNYDLAQFCADISDDEQSLIDVAWQKRREHAIQNGVSVFNAPLIRLSRHIPGNDGTLHLELGKTDYKQYIGTRSPSFSGSRANPIGTCLLPITSDGFIPLGMRSPNADVNAGKYFTFGGFLDANIDMKHGIPDVFSCMRREMQEETGLTISNENLWLIGIVDDLIFCHPEFSFLSYLDIDSNSFRETTWQNELSSLTFIAVDDVHNFVATNNDRIVPTLLGTLNIFMKTT